MNECICCHNRMLRHLNHRRMYWFCPTCHQEMPNIDEIKSHRLKKDRESILFSNKTYSLSS